MLSDRFRRVAIMGAGTMGSDFALIFASADFDVVIYDKSGAALDSLADRQKRSLEEARQAGVEVKDFEAIRDRISVARSLEDVGEVDFVLEAIAEDLEEKRKLFAELDRLPRETVLATNTSSLRVTDIAEGLEGAERVGGMHFSNPPILSPLVEVVKGEKTSEDTLTAIAGVAEKIGKTPVVLRKDVNGFVLNRILMAAGIETMWTFQRGEVTPEELDASLRAIGFPMGFAEAADIIGIDIALAVSRTFREAYGKRFDFPEGFMERMIAEGRLGKKSGRGFYDWSEGPPVIDTSLAGKYDIMRPLACTANEAFWLISDEVADPETIDKITKLGFRSLVGVCELADSMGLDKLIDVLRRNYAEYGIELYKPCPLFEEYVEKGWTGKEAGRGFYEY